MSIQVHDDVAGQDVYIVQSTSPPVNDSLMELVLMVSALRRASCKSITAVMPYFGYGRQDLIRNNKLETVGASDVCRLLESAGVDRIISVDLHVGQIEGFFGSIIGFFLMPYMIAVPYFRNLRLHAPVIVSPSANGGKSPRICHSPLPYFSRPFRTIFQCSNSYLSLYHFYWFSCTHLLCDFISLSIYIYMYYICF